VAYWGDQFLYLGGLGVGLGVRVLGALNFTTNNKLADIIFLGEVEEAADLGGLLGPELLGKHGVGQTGDIVFALLDDNEGQGGNVGSHDAPADKFAFALTNPTGSEARVALGEQEANPLGCQNTLFHGELHTQESKEMSKKAMHICAFGVTALTPCLLFPPEILKV
jgi:hypothetical protein